MKGKTHVSIAIATITPLLHTPVLNSIIYIPYVILGALLPDIDSPRSLIRSRRYLLFLLSLILVLTYEASKKSQYISIIIMLSLMLFIHTLGHRKFTHSILGTLVFSLCVFNVSPYAGLPFFIGYMSHLAADSFTRQGVPLFYPRSKRFGVGLINTGSYLESIILVLCLVFIIYNIRVL